MPSPSTKNWWPFPPTTREVQLDEKWAFVSQRVYGKYFEKSQGVTSHSVPLMRLVTSVFQQFAVAFDFADESQHLVVKRNTFRTPSQAHRSRAVRGQMGPTRGTASGRLPLGPVPAWLRGEDHHLRGHPREVEQLTLFQAFPKGLGDPVARIGDDHVAGQEPLVANLVEQVQGDLALGPLPAVLLGDTDLLETPGRTRPGLGDVEPQGRGEVSLGSDVGTGQQLLEQLAW